MHLLQNFDAQAIIFDKDGTLIDFDHMWGTWTLQLAEHLRAVTGLDAREALCHAYGYDSILKKVLPDGRLTYMTMWRLREIMVETIQSLGLSEVQAEHAVENAWFVPDPVALAKPFTDIHKLFANIRKQNIKVAIATSDDRGATEAMLHSLGVQGLVNTMVCADDGIRSKPEPDMVTTICARLNVDPSRTIVVGDTVADMQMARSSGAGYTIGVLSGVGLLEHLTPLADILIDTVDTLQESFILKEQTETSVLDASEGLTGFNPDPAY
jgi:phosphoglycolate phosphatase